MSQLISHQVLVTGISRHPELSVQKGGRFSPIDFPISVVLLEMSSGYWLFDTGVGPQMQRLKSGVLSRLYPIVVPYSASVDGSAAQQLRDRGIDPSDVERVVVSHFHADHIGGLRDFPNAEIVGHLDGLEQLFTERGVTAARKALFASVKTDPAPRTILRALLPAILGQSGYAKVLKRRNSSLRPDMPTTAREKV